MTHRQLRPCFPRLLSALITIIAAQTPTIANSFSIMSGQSPPNAAAPFTVLAASTVVPPVTGVTGTKTSKTSSRPKRTFYRRPMPDTCVALSSPEGRKIFTSAHNSQGLKSFFPLMEQFSTQTEPAYCGPTTLVVILNALAVDPRRTWKGPWRWYEESFLNCCVDLEEVKKTGITLGTFECLAKCQGLTVEARHGSDASIEEFREAVKAACLESTDEVSSSSNNDKGNSTASHQFLAVSYTRKVVGQTGDGHFSPIAAYDEASDSVLVLDTARFKYGPHWMPLRVMFDALQPIDKATGKSRGYVLLSYDYSDQSSNMPRSILFRSKKGQNPIRRLFKNYLKVMEYEVSFEDVLKFWTKDEQYVDYIWSILDPQLVPTSQEEEDMVTNARSLLTDLMGYVSSNASSDQIKAQYDERLLFETKSMCADSCAGNSCEDTFTSRKIAISSIEAILVLYLATKEADQRRKLFQRFREENGERGYPNVTYEQIMCEADLIHYAIEASDEAEQEGAFGSGRSSV